MLLQIPVSQPEIFICTRTSIVERSKKILAWRIQESIFGWKEIKLKLLICKLYFKKACLVHSRTTIYQEEDFYRSSSRSTLISGSKLWVSTSRKFSFWRTEPINPRALSSTIVYLRFRPKKAHLQKRSGLRLRYHLSQRKQQQ
jgi:hypothetical protein